MNKNILLGIIILICTIYILFINKFDKLDNVVLSKYHKRINNKKSSLDHLSSIISNLPKINHKIDLNDYELYKNIKENIIYYIGKKQTQENTPIETNNNSITSTIKKYYESMKNYVNPGMVSVQTNGSKNKDDWTIDESNNINNNKNSLIEKNDIGNEITNFFDINNPKNLSDKIRLITKLPIKKFNYFNISESYLIKQKKFKNELSKLYSKEE
jgi:hypothetical protein